MAEMTKGFVIAGPDSQLSANCEMITALKRFADGGGPVYAEGGGLMNLASQISTHDGPAHAMANVLPNKVEMTDHLVNLVYAEGFHAKTCSRATFISIFCRAPGSPAPS